MELGSCYLFAFYLINFLVLICGQQGVPPGVPPQHYQQQHHQMHQQQVPVHNQMPPIQQVPMQQVPVQQQQMHMAAPQQQQIHMAAPQQQQMHMQQPGGGGVPHGHQHHGQHHGGQPQVLNVNVAQEKQHIAEHMAVPMDTSKMSEQELQFHYFKMHDADNNNKLDGCELIKSLIHWHEQGHVDPSTGQKTQHVQEKLFKDEELSSLIDPILSMDDSNNDGFIDYPEFVRAQQKAAMAPPHHQQPPPPPK